MKKPYAYLLAGDGPNTDTRMVIEDLATVFKSNKKNEPHVAYIGAASLDNVEFFGFIEPLLKKAGAGEISFIESVGKKANISHSRKLLSAADVIFLSGGEPEDGMIWLSDSGLDTLLSKLFFENIPFIGLSAGSIMMGQHWVHWDVEGENGSATLIDCLNFIPHTFDAHGEKEDWSDLHCAVDLLGPNACGYGLSANGFYVADTKGEITSYREPYAEISVNLPRKIFRSPSFSRK